MASVAWLAVFFLLMVELVITALLVLPLPKFLRKLMARKIFTYDLAKRFRFFSNFIILALLIAISDAITTLRHLEHKEESVREGDASYPDARTGYIGASFDKQRKFRAERNSKFMVYQQITNCVMFYSGRVYLAGFAFTLVFVIARLVELMQDNFNMEEEKEALSKRLKDVSDSASKSTVVPTTDISPPEGTEMTSLRRRTNVTTENVDKTD